MSVKSGLDHFAHHLSDELQPAFASAGQHSPSAAEPKHDEHKSGKHDFVHAIVGALDNAYDQGQFKHLVIVAPARSVAEFRTLAPERLRRTVWREVLEELMHLSDHDLQTRLTTELA